MQELLEILNQKGAVVTADAMHCQKHTGKIIIDWEADYVIQVKDNQPKLLAASVTSGVKTVSATNESVPKQRKRRIGVVRKPEPGWSVWPLLR